MRELQARAGALGSELERGAKLIRELTDDSRIYRPWLEGLCLRYFCCCVFSYSQSYLVGRSISVCKLYSASLPTVVGLVPYGWYPQTRNTGWPPIHSRTYPRTTLLVLLLLACGDIQKKTWSHRPLVMDNLCSVISLLRPHNFANLVILGDFNIDPNVPHSSQLMAIHSLKKTSFSGYG